MIRLINGSTVSGYSRSVFQREGQQIAGYMVYFTYPLTAEGSRGEAVGSLWVSREYFDSNVIEVGSSISVARLRQGDKTKFQLVG